MCGNRYYVCDCVCMVHLYVECMCAWACVRMCVLSLGTVAKEEREQ